MIPKEEKKPIYGLLQGLKIAREQDPRFQYAWENVGHRAEELQKDEGTVGRGRTDLWVRLREKEHETLQGMAIPRGEDIWSPPKEELGDMIMILVNWLGSVHGDFVWRII